jgi:hypothetical protein
MSRSPLTARAFAVGAPLALAIVELFHPELHDLLRIDVQRWMSVHYAQLMLFLLAAATGQLGPRPRGILSRTARF